MDLFETADIVIYIKGRGVVVKEKSLLAFDTISKKVVATGNDAEDMLRNPQENIEVISPLRRGMIADYTAAVELMRSLLQKAWGKKPLIKQPVSVCAKRNYRRGKESTFGCFISVRCKRTFYYGHFYGTTVKRTAQFSKESAKRENFYQHHKGNARTLYCGANSRDAPVCRTGKHINGKGK